jgi:tetrahydromethanopterin S-methyltransferase subunit G
MKMHENFEKEEMRKELKECKEKISILFELNENINKRSDDLEKEIKFLNTKIWELMGKDDKIVIKEGTK